MYTIDRINRLLTRYGLPIMPSGYLCLTGMLWDNTLNPKPGHKVLDALDTAACIKTQGTLGGRIARHEKNLAGERLIR